MKKILMILMMVVTMMGGFIGCATTFGIGTNGIKENKLTSVSYLKSICDVKLIHSKKDGAVYVLDDGKGYFVNKKNSQKICLIVKDGELYGRSESYLPHNITVTFNMHESKCTQICTTESNGAFWYYPDEKLDEMTKYIKDGMINLAKEWELRKYIDNVE